MDTNDISDMDRLGDLLNNPPGASGPDTPPHPAPNKRIDPVDHSILARGNIPKGDGTYVEIDYNPKTGGVFLDAGELEELSKIPDVIGKLEVLLGSPTPLR